MVQPRSFFIFSRYFNTTTKSISLHHHHHEHHRQFATSSASTSKQHSVLLTRALSPYVPKSGIELAEYMAENVIYHAPGDVLAIEKPYGVSCLGYIQKGHGVFGYSREDYEERENSVYNKRKVDSPTLDDAIPHLKTHFQEPELHFCTGLKRYVSGPIVLPCSSKAYKRIMHSIFQGSSIAKTTKERSAQHIYRALAICISRPKLDTGTVTGYAMHQNTKKAVEYIFVEGTIKKRARNGEYASQGEISYEVLAARDGLSLVNLQFSKFSMHFPRLFLCYLGAPILGDWIYTRRLLDVEGQPIIIEPKDVYRGGKRYEPMEFLQSLGLSNLNELKPTPPLYLSVYKTVLPFYGDSKSARRKTELRLRTPPPEHFLAMAELLQFKPALERLFNVLDQEDSTEGNIETSINKKS